MQRSLENEIDKEKGGKGEVRRKKIIEKGKEGKGIGKGCFLIILFLFCICLFFYFVFAFILFFVAVEE